MNRRSFLGLLAAPAIIRVADLMPVKRIVGKSPLLAAPYRGMVQFVGNPNPPTSFEEYTREIVARIARGYGITYDQLTGEYHAQDGFSSSRDGNPWGRSLGSQRGDEELFRRLAEA